MKVAVEGKCLESGGLTSQTYYSLQNEVSCFSLRSKRCLEDAGLPQFIAPLSCPDFSHETSAWFSVGFQTVEESGRAEGREVLAYFLWTFIKFFPCHTHTQIRLCVSDIKNLVVPDRQEVSSKCFQWLCCFGEESWFCVALCMWCVHDFLCSCLCSHPDVCYMFIYIYDCVCLSVCVIAVYIDLCV